MMSAPGVEIRIDILISFLQSLYEIELDHCFCPELVEHVTNQNTFGWRGKSYVNKHSDGYKMHEDGNNFTNFEWQLQEIWANKFK